MPSGHRCVVDVGANRGYLAVFITVTFGAVHLFCFEPERETSTFYEPISLLTGVEGVELNRLP
jgi:hypothetical protein